MILLKFYHSRNVFKGHEFASWLRQFKSAKFEGFEYGRYFPQVSISLQEFEQFKDSIPTKNLVEIEGRFDILMQLVFGVRNFKNRI